ncbi:hypothetical protein [Brucella intermedia]|uniref:hypothetical protein n=1 Tax=Brucella intermedia TaxID=94625 RepID=UPI002362AB23|nr:hypothetical protein [Brucella intermedia]
MPKSEVLVALAAMSVVNISLAEEVDQKSIAVGSAHWVSSSGDKSSTDAMVDIGTMRQRGDALEVIIRWPYLPSSYGPEVVEKMHIICRADGALSFSVAEGHVSPDGHFQFQNVYDPAGQRAEAEKRDSRMAKISNGVSSYGSDPRSLACWAAARKCANEAFVWPPPPNETPLEYTEHSRKMNADYNEMFVPTCELE